MKIGEAAQRSGVSIKMIRHYETIDLIPSAERQASNYRTYDDTDIRRLRFIRRARDLGFSMERIKLLLRLWTDKHRASAEVKAVALAHAAELETKIQHMRDMLDELHILADACEGNDQAACPIIDRLDRNMERDRPAH